LINSDLAAANAAGGRLEMYCLRLFEARIILLTVYRRGARSDVTWGGWRLWKKVGSMAKLGFKAKLSAWTVAGNNCGR
jgi:hypothetical protein